MNPSRGPDESELRRYRVRIFEDNWNAGEDDLRHRTDYWSHSDRTDRDRDRGGYDVDEMRPHRRIVS